MSWGQHEPALPLVTERGGGELAEPGRQGAADPEIRSYAACYGVSLH